MVRFLNTRSNAFASNQSREPLRQDREPLRQDLVHTKHTSPKELLHTTTIYTPLGIHDASQLVFHHPSKRREGRGGGTMRDKALHPEKSNPSHLSVCVYVLLICYATRRGLE